MIKEQTAKPREAVPFRRAECDADIAESWSFLDPVGKALPYQRELGEDFCFVYYLKRTARLRDKAGLLRKHFFQLLA
jgi:hypothetical protein